LEALCPPANDAALPTAFLTLCSSISLADGSNLPVASLKEAGEDVANERIWEILSVWMGDGGVSDGRRRRTMVGKRIPRMRVPECDG
jgi:hypothetical protein